MGQAGWPRALPQKMYASMETSALEAVHVTYIRLCKSGAPAGSSCRLRRLSYTQRQLTIVMFLSVHLRVVRVL